MTLICARIFNGKDIGTFFLGSERPKIEQRWLACATTTNGRLTLSDTGLCKLSSFLDGAASVLTGSDFLEVSASSCLPMKYDLVCQLEDLIWLYTNYLHKPCNTRTISRSIQFENLYFYLHWRWRSIAESYVNAFNTRKVAYIAAGGGILLQWRSHHTCWC